MGSAGSSLNDEQRAHVAKLMKENYERISTTVPPNEIQKHMEKIYEELINSLKTPTSLDGQKKDCLKKKTATRRRSYGEDKLKKKNLPPKPPVKSVSNANETANESQTTSAPQHQHQHHHQQQQSHEETTTQEEVPSHIEENVDSWDSVHSQPSCPLCKMIFATPTKYDTHVKYSEVHAQNLNKQKQQLEALTRPASAPHIEVVRPASAPPGPRCRELYTGSKFFWRQKQSIEIHIYLHLGSRCIEICSYNNNQSQEFPRIYLEEAKLIKLIGEKTFVEKVEEMKENIPAQEPLPADDILEEEARRLLISAHIMNRIQFTSSSSSAAAATSHERIEYQFTPNIQFPELPSPLLETPPDGLIPVMIARRRLSTTKEIENAFQTFNNMEAELLNSTQKAEKMIDKITLENDNLLKQSTNQEALNSARRHSK